MVASPAQRHPPVSFAAVAADGAINPWVQGERTMNGREMAGRRSCRGRIMGAAALVAAMVGSGRASGQGTAKASFEILGGDRQSCVVGYQALTAELTGCPDSPWQGTIVSRASAIDGVLKAEGQLVWTGTSPGGFTGQLNNEAKWYDRIHVSGVQAAYVDLTIRVNGFFSAFVTPGAPSFAGAGAGLGFGPGEWPSGSVLQQVGVNGQDCQSYGGSCTRTSSYDQEITQRFLLSGGTADFGVRLGTPIAVGAYVVGTYDAGGASDFSHTLNFTSYKVFDASGTDVTDAATASFDNGTRFLAAVTVAPEPSTLVLMATGLCLMGGLASRRRQARKSRGGCVGSEASDARDRPFAPHLEGRNAGTPC
jgi:hypothetical protein